jgi:hypothetical protein
MPIAAQVKFCNLCSGLRSLPLHLFELAAYADYLDNIRMTYTRKKKILKADKDALTSTIANWLRLASQIERVDLNTYQFQVAQDYCEPVAALLDSDAEHYSRLATPLTRFIVFCNALEETYRFLSPSYEKNFNKALALNPKQEYLRSPSIQAAFLLDQSAGTSIPAGYIHLVDNLSKVAKQYFEQTGGVLDTAGKSAEDLSFGLQLVRNIRNHVAHGVFPLLGNPNYSWSSNDLQVRNTINLLNQCTRVGAVAIQIMLNMDSDGFQSQLFEDASEDPETGHYFSERMLGGYLMTLHRLQEFGLNEEAYFKWSENSARPPEEI